MFPLWFSIIIFLAILRIRHNMATNYLWCKLLGWSTSLNRASSVRPAPFEEAVLESLNNAKACGVASREYCERIERNVEILKSLHLEFINSVLLSHGKLIFIFTALGSLYMFYLRDSLDIAEYLSALAWICAAQLLLLLFSQAAAFLQTVGKVSLDELVAVTTFSIEFVRKGSNSRLLQALQKKIKSDSRMGRSYAHNVRASVEIELQKIPTLLKANRKKFGVLLVFVEIIFSIPMLLHITLKFLENSHSI